MSYTELYTFDKEGNAKDLGEIQNSWRGAMAIWNILDKRYLPKFIPEWAKVTKEYLVKDYYRSSDPEKIKEIWNLYKDEKISETDKIVLASTFDNVVVKKENINRLIKAFREFEGETSLSEQADMIESVVNDPDVIAIAWNQTSVMADNWVSYEWNEEKEESICYNLNDMNKHWFLFED